MKIKHVLVVDDSKSARFMLRKMLVSTDLAADMVESGEEALNYLKTKRPDAIFMDHMMPGMDGIETLEKIKSKPKYVSIPVIMYTSKEGDDYANEVKSKGAFAILPKPASPDNLIVVLNELKATPEIPAAAPAEVPAQPSDIHIHISQDDIDLMVKKSADTIVASLVRQQLAQALAENPPPEKQEAHDVVDEDAVNKIAQQVFDSQIIFYSDKLSARLDDLTATTEANARQIEQQNFALDKTAQQLEEQIVSTDKTTQQLEHYIIAADKITQQLEKHIEASDNITRQLEEHIKSPDEATTELQKNFLETDKRLEELETNRLASTSSDQAAAELQKHSSESDKILEELQAHRVSSNNTIKNLIEQMTSSDKMVKDLSEQISGINNRLANSQQNKTINVDPQTLEEIKSVAKLASTSKAIEAAQETAVSVVEQALRNMPDKGGQQLESKITLMTFVASAVGIASAVAVYFTLV